MHKPARQSVLSRKQPYHNDFRISSPLLSQAVVAMAAIINPQWLHSQTMLLFQSTKDKLIFGRKLVFFDTLNQTCCCLLHMRWPRERKKGEKKHGGKSSLGTDKISWRFMHNVPPTFDTKTDIGHLLLKCSSLCLVWSRCSRWVETFLCVCECECMCMCVCWCLVCTYRHITFSAGVAFSCKSEIYIFDLKFYCKRSVYFSLKLCHLSSCLQPIFYCCQVDSLLLLCFIGSYKSYEWMCITISIRSVFLWPTGWVTSRPAFCLSQICEKYTFTEVP